MILTFVLPFKFDFQTNAYSGEVIIPTKGNNKMQGICIVSYIFVPNRRNFALCAENCSRLPRRRIGSTAIHYACHREYRVISGREKQIIKDGEKTIAAFMIRVRATYYPIRVYPIPDRRELIIRV